MRPPLALLLLALILTACSSDGEPTATQTSTSPSPAVTSATPASSPSPDDEPTPSPTPQTSPTQTSPTQSVEDVTLALEEVGSGFSSPLLVTAPPGASGIWVAEQPGTVRVIEAGDVRTFLDIRRRVTSGGERGLLGLAFHPDYAGNGRVFVHYSGDGGRTVLSEFEAAGSPRSVDPSTEQVLLTVAQPASNHNGGSVLFGPDGLLYLALGDGGGGGDQFGNGQDPSSLLGTLLRLDVSTPGESAIPPENPFADGEGGAPEVYSYGLRNPYRIAFGPDGTLYIADVGQNAVEEVNALPYEEANGANFGWPILEGTHCFRSDDCDPEGTVLPVHDYTHADTGGCTVIGGAVYTGGAMPGIGGHYFFTDLCAGFLRSLDGAGTAHDWTSDVGSFSRPLSIGSDAEGEVYVAEQGGRILRLVPAS